MLNSRSRRLKVVRSTASAMKTPTWKAIQNQILVDTAQTVPFSSATRNAKAPQSIHAHALDVAIYDRRNLRRRRSWTAATEDFHSRTEAFFVACSTPMDAELEKLVEAGK